MIWELWLLHEKSDYSNYMYYIRHILLFWPVSTGTSKLVRNCRRKWTLDRGGSRIFLRRGAPLRNGVTDWWGKQIVKVNTKKKASSQGGVHPRHPPPRSAPVRERLLWDTEQTTAAKGQGQFDQDILHKVSLK